MIFFLEGKVNEETTQCVPFKKKLFTSIRFNCMYKSIIKQYVMKANSILAGTVNLTES